jgi:hypothetical protein
MQWKPADLIIIIVTISVCLALLLAMLKPLITGEPLSVEKAEMVKIIILTLVALVSVYIGKKV